MRLIITFKNDASSVLPLVEMKALRIGRGKECELQLEDPSVSRLHLQLQLDAGRVLIKDLNSRFGTFVNGVKTSECELRTGDVVRIGETTLRLDDESKMLRTTLAPVDDRKMSPPARPAFQVDGSNEQRPVVPRSSPIQAPTAHAENEGGQASPSSDFRPQGLVGRRLGRFQVKSLVAQTSHGAIFRAADDKLRTDVALKIFDPGILQGSAVARLERAVRITIPLSHPHLVELYDSGHDDGLSWMASEFIEGENAAQLIRRIGVAGMLDWRQTLKAAIHVSRALVFIGQHQIIHRNISPRNILIQKRDGIAKLGDLVLAKSLDDDAMVQITRAGEIVGDLAYCAPEQVIGQPVDRRTDQYNLGATLYALLTGRPPCEGRSFEETVDMILNRPPEPPTKYHLSIPPLLEGLVLRTLAKRPDDRFADSAALLFDLERIARYLGETSLLSVNG